MISRRDFIKMAGAASAAAAVPQATAATPRRLTMGGTSTAFTVRSQYPKRQGKVFDQLEHCHSLGMGGAETGLPSLEPADIKAFRTKLESYDMYLMPTGCACPRRKGTCRNSSGRCGASRKPEPRPRAIL